MYSICVCVLNIEIYINKTIANYTYHTDLYCTYINIYVCMYMRVCVYRCTLSIILHSYTPNIYSYTKKVNIMRTLRLNSRSPCV